MKPIDTVLVTWSILGGTLTVPPEYELAFVQLGVHHEATAQIVNLDVPGFSQVNENCTSCDNGDPRTVWLFSTVVGETNSVSWGWDVEGEGELILFDDSVSGSNCGGIPVTHVIVEGPLGPELWEVCAGTFEVLPPSLYVGQPTGVDYAPTWSTIKNLYR